MRINKMLVAAVAAATMTLPATAEAHRPGMRAMKSEASAAVNDWVFHCRGTLGNRPTVIRFIKGTTRAHTRSFYVTTFDGYMEAFLYRVRVGHDANSYAQVQQVSFVRSTVDDPKCKR